MTYMITIAFFTAGVLYWSLKTLVEGSIDFQNDIQNIS